MLNSIYLSQHGSGGYSKTNCAPACVAMATNLQLSNKHTVKQIRDLGCSSIFWNDHCVKDALSKVNLHNNPQHIRDCEQLDECVDKSLVTIININMWDMPRSGRFNKPYKTYHRWWGHYLLLVNSAGSYYEILDPYHDNGAPRLYDKDLIMSCMQRHNRNVFNII